MTNGRRRTMVWGMAATLLVAGCGAPVEEPGTNPANLLAADIAAGRHVYDNNGCANCHGSDGSGRGPNAAYMNPPPRDYRDPSAYKAGIGVEEVARSIATGFSEEGAAMPAFAHLTVEQLQQLASFVVSLQRPETEAVEVSDAWIAETAPGTSVAAAYMKLTNVAMESDALIGIEAVAARARVHATRERDRITGMEPLERLELGTGEVVELAPGGIHVMLSGLRAPLVTGDVLQMTLYFESQTARRLSVPVRRRDAAN